MTGSTGPPWHVPTIRLWARAETLIVLALTFALAVAYLAARDAGPFQVIEGQSLDWRFRLRGPLAAGTEIAIVAIDDRTLAELGRWPFSRSWLAAAVDAIAADGARSIVFDLLLVGSEAHGNPSGAMGAEGARNDGSLEAAANDADRTLEDAIARAGNVVVPFAFVYDAAEANVSVLPPAIENAAYRVVRSHSSRSAVLPDHPAGALVPLASFVGAGRPAHVTVFVDADGSLRFSHAAIRYGDSYYPSLPVEGARLFFGVDRQDVSLDLGVGLSIGDRFFGTGPGMALPINYAGPSGTFETWSLIDVVNGKFAPDTFRGRLVLIGPSAVGLGDRFKTPYSAMLPGVEVFANVIDNFLRHGFLRRSTQTEWLDLLAIVLAGALAASLGLLRRPATAMLATTALIGVWSALNVFGFVAWRTWLNFTFPTLALLFGSATVIAGLAVRETRRRTSAEQRGETLSRYVSPLTMSGLQARTGSAGVDRVQEAAVMCVDLVGFTHASETLAPAAAAQLLRHFHGCVERAALIHGGVIDKFIGDAALVVFGVPVARLSDAASAVRCARRIAGELADRKAGTEAAGGPGLMCGVGIDFGAVTIAEVGGSAHAQITVTGDTVNVASRLEALTREWGTTIIISDAVFEAARAAGAAEVLDAFERLPVQRIRGRDGTIALWAWPAPMKD